jgi:hypothetical protein
MTQRSDGVDLGGPGSIDMNRSPIIVSTLTDLG